MRNWLALPLVVGPLLLGCARLNWVPFRSPEGGFVLTMPGEPREQIRPLQTVNGRIDLHSFATQPTGGTRAYLVSYENQSTVAASKPAQLMLAGCVNAFKKLAESGGELLTCRSCSLQGFPGREVAMINAKGTFMIDRMFVANRRLYQVMVVAPGERASDDDERKFLDSFRIVQKP
jgi:hypothetical protein